MNKLKLTLVTTFVLAVMFTVQTNANAAVLDYFKMVRASDLGLAGSSQAYNNAFDAFDGSFDNAVEEVYGWNDTPYLYLGLSAPLANPMTLWAGPTDADSYLLTALADSDPTDANYWYTISNWNPTNRKAGQWDVFTDAASCGENCYTSSFVVTPEPMSMVLYGLGGLPIAATLLRRRKVSNV